MVSAGFEIATFTLAGSFKILCASFTILGGIVAENKRVCLFVGSLSTIRMMSWLKPMSSILSASSRIKYSTPERSKLEIDRKDNNLPGVAIITSVPFLRDSDCVVQLFPSPPP